MTTLQHESSSLKISADGRCEQASPRVRHGLVDKSLKSFEIIIDATHLQGGEMSSIIGDDFHYLPTSEEFSLDHFEPREDGTCILRYTRCELTHDQ
ncbi:MAG: hypothetical protein ACPIA7_08665 [Akkermansiaceae bacterium]